MNDAHTQTNLTCTGCGYLLDGLNLRENCPECGKRIVNDCFWCEYDLSDTAPDSNCPECGVPVTASIGHGVLASVPVEKLSRIHSGMKQVTMFILLYIVAVIGSVITLIWLSGNGAPNSTIYYSVIGTALITNGTLLVILLGWWKISIPIDELPRTLDVLQLRSFLRIMLVIVIVHTILTVINALIPQNFDPLAPTTAQDIITGILNLIGLLLYLIAFIAQVRYIGWIAKLVGNTKMYKRSKHFVWSGPVVAVLGSIFMFIGPLIVLIVYWNMIEYTRRDLKKVIISTERNRIASA